MRWMYWISPLVVLGIWCGTAMGEVQREPCPYTLENQLDLNRASLEEIQRLPLEPEDALSIYRFRQERGAFVSVYALTEVDGIDAHDFERIKYLVRIEPPEEGREVARNIEELQRRLATEEGPGEGALDEWEDLLRNPMNINQATVDDLVLLDRVTLVDAASVVRHRSRWGTFKSDRDLRRSSGLTHYGYGNMRDYIRYDTPSDGLKMHGTYRMQFSYDDRFDVDEGDVADKLDMLDAAIEQLRRVSGDTTNTRTRLEDAGWTPDQIDALQLRLREERDSLGALRPTGTMLHKLRLSWGDNIKLGIATGRHEGDRNGLAFLKGYLGLYRDDVVQKFIVGDYRATIGQGIMMDNTSYGEGESPFRRTSTTAGLFGDATSSRTMTFRGAATQLKVGRFQPLLFLSRSPRDAILNPDGTANLLFSSTPRLYTWQDKLDEETYGGSFRVDLSDVGGLFPGTYVALNAYQSDYDREFRPDPTVLDIPGDKDTLRDPNYLQGFSGDRRRVIGGDFRTVFNNFSLEGEYARLDGGGRAHLVKARADYEYLYLLVIHRHYDVDYDNPYCRGFLEQRRFDDTIFEKDYRLLDPLYIDLQEYPTPKAEEGLYMETRFQINRRITLTKVYVDMWKNLAYMVPNIRFQGEVEFRPVFPLRFRVKHKWQKKELPKVIVPTTSRTSETTLRTFVLITDSDYFNLEARYGRVNLTPTEKYVGDLLMSGSYLAGAWEHNFSPRVSVLGGVAVWESNGMSQWIFEDVGIDFLDRDGIKYYITVSDQVSPNLWIRFKFLNKTTLATHTGLRTLESAYHYSDGSEGSVHDFTDRKGQYGFQLQADLRW
jgi:DNA uptake protein ComE-like DNA-binding protein